MNHHDTPGLPWLWLRNCHLRRHDDVIKRKHFPRYWPFVRGSHRLPVNSPHKSQWRGALMFSLIYAWINGWVNNREAGDLRRHRAHYRRHCNELARSKLMEGPVNTDFLIIMLCWYYSMPLRRRHNERNGVLNHGGLDCYWTVCSGAHQRKHQSSESLDFARESTGDRWIPHTKGQ